MAKNRKEAVIFVVNIGKTSTEIADNETESFLDKAKTVIKQVVERKIFMRPKDLINVFCIGANETKNDAYVEYIKQLEPELLVPTWTLVQDVLNLEGTDKTSIWVEGLHVALEFIKEKCIGIDVTPIVMIINDFQEDPDIIQQFNAKDLANDVLSAHAKLIIIGKTLNDEEHKNNLNLSERLALNVCDMVGGAYEQIDQYLWETRFYKNPPVKPNPWKCNLRIGDILIPTETYVKVTEPPPFPSWKITQRDNSVGFPPESAKDVKKSKELVDRYRNITQPEQAIKGFKYGGKFIPFSDTDIIETKFIGTEKSLIVRGFVKQEDVSLEYWFGKGSHIIVPRDDPTSKRKFFSLLIAMKRAGQVAIVRKVYQTGSVPKMGVLFPRMEEEEPMCFVHIGIPFAEERRVLKPRPIKSLVNNLSEDEQKDIEDLIDNMTLPANDERFKPGSFCNPCKQNKWDNLAHRALNRVPLPPMNRALLDLISPPKSLLQRAEPVLKRLAEWVKPKVEVKSSKEQVENTVNDQDKTQKTDEELMRAAEEVEDEVRKKEELFSEISQATMDVDEDLLNEM